MAVDLSSLKKVRPSVSKLIFGFCREIHQSFISEDAYYSVQPLIVYTCLAYYYIKHEWDMTNVSKECLIEGDFITKIEQTYDTTSLLTDEISNGIHEYEFKIISYNHKGLNYYDVSIGIISSEYYENNKNDLIHECFLDKETSFGFTPSKGVKECYEYDGDAVEYGVRCPKGCIVKMTVDLDNNQLKYKVNDEDLGVAFDNIEKKPYKIALYLYGKGCKVQIMN